MSHNCPQCGMPCHCESNDIEDIVYDCKHPCPEFDDEDDGDVDVFTETEEDESEYV